jgi:glycosyltransferase involved in cell wall biosynthesis
MKKNTFVASAVRAASSLYELPQRTRFYPPAMRLLHNYYIKNSLERRRTKKLVEQSRISANNIVRSKKPLVSVLICTYNRSQKLTERAIPSVLRQTYDNLEIIVVGDHCTDDTEQQLARFNDDRLYFYNLPQRGEYPSSPLYFWQAKGTVPRNKAIELCSGKWIAPLDDDDEFTEDHIEVLLNWALKYDYEFVYGIVQKISAGNRVELVGSYPLVRSRIAHHSVLYDAKLRFFKYNTEVWKYGEAHDWNLWRRMKEAGVRIGFVDRVVGIEWRI